MNPDNYGSLPACKKLAEMLAKKGRVVETEAMWEENSSGAHLVRGRSLPPEDKDTRYYPAYSMPEVWRELRKHITDFQMYGRIWNALREELFIDALIELWVWALE